MASRISTGCVEPSGGEAMASLVLGLSPALVVRIERVRERGRARGAGPCEHQGAGREQSEANALHVLSPLKRVLPNLSALPWWPIGGQGTGVNSAGSRGGGSRPAGTRRHL